MRSPYPASRLKRDSEEGREAAACVPAGPCVVQLVGGRVDGLEGVVEFAVGQESGIAGDVGDVEFEAEAALELGVEVALSGSHPSGVPVMTAGNEREP